MRPTGLPALALVVLGVPHAVVAQLPEPRTQASVEASLIVSTVRESVTTFAGLAGLLSLDGRFAFGAGGGLMLGSATVDGEGPGSDLDLRMAYAGLLVHLTLFGSPDRYVALRTLVGAGSAKIELPVVGSEIAADNFGVLVPEIVGSVPLAGPLQMGLGAGYRHVFGVDDLPNVAPGDLEGFSARIRLSVRTR